MDKLQTQLTHFRYNSFHNHGPFLVTWYKLEENDEEIYGVCLTQSQSTQLSHYFAGNKINFNNQNYFICDEDDAPSCDIYDSLPLKSNNPKNLILRQIPQMSKDGNIYDCMDIELLHSNGALNHNYNLTFDIIGHIE